MLLPSSGIIGHHPSNKLPPTSWASSFLPAKGDMTIVVDPSSDHHEHPLPPTKKTNLVGGRETVENGFDKPQINPHMLAVSRFS